MVREIGDSSVANASVRVNLAPRTVQPPLNIPGGFKTRFDIYLVLQSVRVHNSQNTECLAKTPQTPVQLTLHLTR